jgi:polyribonucleotide nucleotidyltransferase
MVESSKSSSKTYSLEWGGRTLTMEIGKYAGQASGSCLIRYGDTVVLATAVLSKQVREGMSFFPLLVDFEEKLYAAGKIKGSRFIKREGRPTDEAILTARLIDRGIRPLFPKGIRNDIQVVATVLSWDGENDPDILGIIGASCALSVSEIPWDGPIGGIRVGRIPSDDGTKAEWAINPTYAAREKSTIDLVVSGTDERILMLEAAAEIVEDSVIEEAAAFALKHLRPLMTLLTQIKEECGKPAWAPPVAESSEDEDRAVAAAQTFLASRVPEVLRQGVREEKSERLALVSGLEKELNDHLESLQIGKEKRRRALGTVKDAIESGVTQLILEEDRRVDGRTLDAIRTLSVDVGMLPRTHGSGYFSRGETSVMSVVTLGSPGDEQLLDTMEFAGKKRYMHHYNFPSFSVGEVRPMRGPGRRDIGHGSLAERALEPVLPSKEDFPYTIRVVSEVLSSNGSSSMASTCGSTLSLMDAGVPLAAPVAGIAMGLASDDQGRWKVLSDLQDLEDGKGGMDFKVAGTPTGITAVQMDTKTNGVTMDMLRATMAAARPALARVLESMTAVLPTHRVELSQYAPRVQTVQIPPDRIRDVIGPGGKTINEIIDATGSQIDIEQTGQIFITSTNAEGMERAVEWIRNLTREAEIGEVFRGPVVRILNFGAFVEILPKKDGLVHISELAPYHVNNVEDIVKIGDVIPVKVTDIDDMGRINLSLKAAVAGGEEFEFPPAPQRSAGGGGDDRSGGPPRRGGPPGHGGGGFRGGPRSGGGRR